MPSHTSSILLVEDDPSLQASLLSFLTENGFEIHAASSRVEGAAMLRSLKPAVCLLDLNLPDGSGLDLLRLIVDEKLPVRVIVMSALPLPRLRQQFPERVLAAMMTKPVSPLQLLDCVDRIANGRGSRCE
jgi:two-component system response regulator CpxR